MVKNQKKIALAILVSEITGHGCKLWMQKREEAGPLSGMLEFPGGKIENGETPLQAALREADEESHGLLIDLQGRKTISLGSFAYDYDDRSVELFAVVFMADGVHEEHPHWHYWSFSSWKEKYGEHLLAANFQVLEELFKRIATF